MMKFRPGKLKYEHHMILGLRRFLESIEDWTEIQSMIPGEIRPTRGMKRLSIHVQYDTPTGIKCLVKSGSAVQEVFFVTSDREKLKQKLEAQNKA